ncbi:MAG: DEAD/DEAH box helicase family protein, partial [Acidobacteria bacterium]|nr:DEAD/DEAH box helicase family protein [Acidobacteriota bacterium]
MHLNELSPGQRWVSESEPELGLGLIEAFTPRHVTVAFKATSEKRVYARNNAPLRRVRFRAGDKITSRDGKRLTVEIVSERNGVLYYTGGGWELCESDLNDAISFTTPEDRLLAGQLDPAELFDLRVAALEHQHRLRKSPVRGFVGGRIDLIPHQLFIASEVAGRRIPRVLLSDEVGLGKTIEACLILHRLILTGRAERVLIIVPDSLVHQWFVELLRRFNLWFHIFDEERCRAIEEVNPGENPFLDDQLILSSISLFITNPQRTEQAVEAGWDILVVDEAHHLGWSPQNPSPEYELVESICRKTPGLLLLTASPEQLGVASHFGRLRLLDADRFYDLDAYIKEVAHYREVAEQAEKAADPNELAALLDQHGTGRVQFRNTRATVTGFPARNVRMHRLEPHSSKLPQLDWLADLLLTLDPEKVILICRTQAKVAAIDAALRQRLKNAKIAVFHEGLSLIQRDRNAAWFADERGAQILICSEIGSEGRNFQFAHHLVLFDLPLDPELLEQRIGRLDRIGQKAEIQVHVPFVAGSGQEVLARWYDEGLNAFAQNIEGGRELLDQFGARVYELTKKFSEGRLNRLIEETRIAHEEIKTRLQEGRDRLLELNSFRPDAAAKLVEEIRRQDEDRSLDEFMLRVFDQYAILVEEIAPRTYKLGSAGVLADSFPGLPAEGFTVTCDRKRALVREDIQFLTWDHPLVTGAIDLLLGSEKGNASAGETGPPFEAIYVLECVAPPQLHIDRFLPPAPIRAESESAAQKQVTEIVSAARREMNAQLESEIARLKELL